MAGGWAWARSSGETSTDNAYVRGNVTPIAPRVAGYVTAVEVEDNQSVKAGDILFRIDDRDYRARLAQAAANIDAAQARLTNVDAEIKLQHTLIRQAEAQLQSTIAELNLATKASGRRRELLRSRAVSQAQVDESDAARLRAERAWPRGRQRSTRSGSASPSSPRRAKPPSRPWRRRVPHAISPRSISTTP
jgi:membrane fusion protein (multidrug efflux system)